MELIFMLAGGLGLFLYGMSQMSNGLQRIAGYRLKSILGTLTTNRFLGVLTGAVSTAFVQSSSVMTVMVVSFVNANLMSLAQAISVIIGANIGTTITAQIIAFKIEEFALPVIAVGAALALFAKREKLKALGDTLFGFGILFYGFFLMSAAFKPLGQESAFLEIFTQFADKPLLALAVGMLVTVVAQSSSLTTGITIALAQTGIINFEQALPLIIGINIGSTITANIAAIPGSYVAKQAARAHIIINLGGAIIAFILLMPFKNLVLAISPQAGGGRLIANAHTLFNVLTSFIALPLISHIATGTKYLIYGKPESRESLTYLDTTSLAEPGTALDQVKRALAEMHSAIYGFLKKISDTLLTQKKLDPVDLFKIGETVEHYEKKVTEYLQFLAEKKLTKEQSQTLGREIRMLQELMRMNDYALKISSVIREKVTEGLHFTTIGKRQLRNLFKTVEGLNKKTGEILQEPSIKTAENIIVRYEELRAMRDGLREKSKTRFAKHTTNLQTMHAYIDIINALEEIGKKSANIAETVRTG